MVRVYKPENYLDADTIWAEHDGQETYITYYMVDTATLVPSSRVDGYEELVLVDGRTVKVQSIDIDYAEPIGATVFYKWKDFNDEETQSYVSFGDYDEENNCDSYGNDDNYIFHYFKGVAEFVDEVVKKECRDLEFTISSFEFEYQVWCH